MPYKFIFQPPPAGYSKVSPFIKTIETPDGNKIGVHYRVAKAGMPTILWAHGNAEDLGYLTNRFDAFAQKGFGIYAYDYPGYGISEGKPTEPSCFTAAQAAWNDLTTQLHVSPTDILILGQSVGSGPATWLASQKQSAGLVLITPFVSTFRVVTRVPIFPADKFTNIKLIKKLKTPLLVIHGDQDEVIDQWHGKKLHAMHNGPKQFLNIPGAGHNDIYQIDGEQVIQTINDFYFQHRGLKPSP